MNKKVCFFLLTFFIVLVIGAVIAVIVVLVKDKDTDADNIDCDLYCASNSTCVNTPGGYTCVCNDGFTGNGTFCRALQCPTDWILIVDSCYVMPDIIYHFEGFKLYCNIYAKGGYLVEFEDIDENTRVASFFTANTDKRPYIGGEFISGEWKWLTTSMSFTNWNNGEPSGVGEEKCVHLGSSDGKWSDIACNSKLYGICEIEAM